MKVTLLAHTQLADLNWLGDFNEFNVDDGQVYYTEGLSPTLTTNKFDK